MRVFVDGLSRQYALSSVLSLAYQWFLSLAYAKCNTYEFFWHKLFSGLYVGLSLLTTNAV